MLYDKNLVDMSLRLNRSDPIFRTIREKQLIEQGIKQIALPKIGCGLDKLQIIQFLT